MSKTQEKGRRMKKENFTLYKTLLQIRMLFDENPAKAKQQLTNWIKELEDEE